MARALRIEYPGAIYHVMSRGDHREPIFSDDTDRQRFIETLGGACAKTDWQVHAFCLMRRAREEGDDFKAIRRGWCLGDEIFRQDLLAQAHGRAGENHPAEIRRQTAEAKARRVLGEELDKLGWTEAELARQAKGDVRKVHIARRLRSETAVTLKWIAQNLHMGVWTYVSNQLQNSNLTRTTPKDLRLCQ